MIGLSTVLFDLNGHLVLPYADVESSRPNLSRRVSRVQTLDGAASIYDGGFSWGDVTLMIKIRSLSVLELSRLEYMVTLYTKINVSTRNGALQGTIQSWQPRPPGGILTVLVQKKVS
jgi:hypothetical protein